MTIKTPIRMRVSELSIGEDPVHPGADLARMTLHADRGQAGFRSATLFVTFEGRCAPFELGQRVVVVLQADMPVQPVQHGLGAVEMGDEASPHDDLAAVRS